MAPAPLRALATGALVAILIIPLGWASASGASSAMSQPALTATNAGCGSGGATSTTLHPNVAGHERVALVHVPVGYTGATAVPLVLNLHGSGSTAARQEAFSGMDATANEHGYLVVYPQGLIADGSGFDWNVPGVPLVGARAVPKGAADDIAFLTDLVGLLSDRYCIDAARVYVTGFSGGARMASQLACDASSLFAAAAPVSGLRHPSPCPATRPVPILAFHGTADPVDPYDGHGQAYWTYSVQQAASAWASQDGCAPSPSTQRGNGFTLTTYAGCANGAAVALYSVTGEGHEWPGGPSLARAVTRSLGPQSNAVDANAVMWSFFAAHPLP
jgi:polyhydroxybutyrate depolymerase